MAYQIFPMSENTHAQQWSLSGPLLTKAIQAASSYNWEPYVPPNLKDEDKDKKFFKCLKTDVIVQQPDTSVNIMLTGERFDQVLLITMDEHIIKDIIQ